MTGSSAAELPLESGRIILAKYYTVGELNIIIIFASIHCSFSTPSRSGDSHSPSGRDHPPGSDQDVSIGAGSHLGEYELFVLSFLCLGLLIINFIIIIVYCL